MNSYLRHIICFFSFFIILFIINKESTASEITNSYYKTSIVSKPKSRPINLIFNHFKKVYISNPVSRPNPESIFPISTNNIKQFIQKETGAFTKNIKIFYLNNGDNLGKILRKAKIKNIEIDLISKSLSSKLNLRRLQIGTLFKVAYDKDLSPVGVKVRTFKNTEKNLYFDYYVLRATDDNHWYTIKAIRPVQLKLEYRRNVITDSLYKSAKMVLIPEDKLNEFVKVMSFTIDFQREVRSGDKFEILYEKSLDTLTGNETPNGKLIFSGMILSNKHIGYYRFVNKDGEIGWYDREGKSAQRTLMRTPLNSAKISSKFGYRKHPITGYNAMHRGIDFSVPTGTPIFAAGDGRIEKSGWNGNYGKYIRIRHNSIYKTAYGHLSKIRKNAFNGKFVKQGEIIGYVGSTGRSTGPHLHYEILVNNKKVNPLTVILPSTKNIKIDEIKEFKKQVKHIEKIIGNSIKPEFAELYN